MGLERNNEQVLVYETMRHEAEALESPESLLGKVDYVLLETTSESLISYIDKVEITPEHIYLLSEDRLLVFDHNGKFLHRIGNIGSGPEEAASIVSFAIDRSNESINSTQLLLKQK